MRHSVRYEASDQYSLGVTLNELAAMFPDDETIKESVEAIRKARERRAALPKRPRRINGYR